MHHFAGRQQKPFQNWSEGYRCGTLYSDFCHLSQKQKCSFPDKIKKRSDSPICLQTCFWPKHKAKKQIPHVFEKNQHISLAPLLETHGSNHLLSVLQASQNTSLLLLFLNLSCCCKIQRSESSVTTLFGKFVMVDDSNIFL